MTNGQPWRPFRLSESEAQKRLEALASAKQNMDVRDAFAQDATRVETLSWDLDGLHVDASKQRWDAEVKEALSPWARSGPVWAIADLFGVSN